jgi:hypothetical protein
MTWTTKPRDDVFRALCRTAIAARASEHGATPVIVVSDTTMLPLVVPPYRDGIIKLGRRRLETWCEAEDWANEDWLHLGALAACAFLVAFAFVVIVAS